MPALTPTDLGPDDRFGDIPAFGILGEILDQDVTIMGLNQAGLRASRQPGLKLGVYQESRIRHYHRTLDRFISR